MAISPTNIPIFAANAASRAPFSWSLLETAPVPAARAVLAIL